MKRNFINSGEDLDEPSEKKRRNPGGNVTYISAQDSQDTYTFYQPQYSGSGETEVHSSQLRYSSPQYPIRPRLTQCSAEEGIDYPPFHHTSAPLHQTYRRTQDETYYQPQTSISEHRFRSAQPISAMSPEVRTTYTPPLYRDPEWQPKADDRYVKSETAQPWRYKEARRSTTQPAQYMSSSYLSDVPPEKKGYRVERYTSQGRQEYARQSNDGNIIPRAQSEPEQVARPAPWEPHNYPRRYAPATERISQTPRLHADPASCSRQPELMFLPTYPSVATNRPGSVRAGSETLNVHSGGYIESEYRVTKEISTEHNYSILHLEPSRIFLLHLPI